MQDFKIKTQIYFGKGALSKLKEIGNKKVFIVTDPFMIKSGMINRVAENLIKEKTSIFSEVVPDPPIELIAKGIEELKKSRPEVIIALGGGSSIDAAKAIMDFAKRVTDIEDIEFIAIPTTSGTGSEVTSFAVITDREKGVKYPLVSDGLLPNVAILDPELVKSVPDFITADTGIDVITHALEAYVSTKATDFSDALAEKALALAFENLLNVYKNGDDMVSREKMHNASCLAGIAFNSASLGINHSIAHIIGAKFHVPHGRANGLLLPYVIRFNAEILGYGNGEYSLAAKKYSKISRLLGFLSPNPRIGVTSLINEIKKLQKAMNMPTTLKDCNVEPKDVDDFKNEMAVIALKDSCTETNPKALNEEDIIRIINDIKE